MTQPTDHSIVRQERLLDPPRALIPADHSFHNPPRLFAVPTY